MSRGYYNHETRNVEYDDNDQDLDDRYYPPAMKFKIAQAVEAGIDPDAARAALEQEEADEIRTANDAHLARVEGGIYP